MPSLVCTTSLQFHELVPLATIVGNLVHKAVRPSSRTVLGSNSTATSFGIGNDAQ